MIYTDQNTRAHWPKNGAILLVSHVEGLSPPVPAFEYAKNLLSENSVRSAALFDSQSHPDFCFIHPEKNSDWIKIDQIRELIDWAAGRPQISDKKIAILSPAHALNIQAANALLKTLEEPSIDTLFILVTDKPSLLPATIRSRCHWIRQKLSFISPISPELRAELIKDLQDLKAEKAEPVLISERWIKHNPKQVLDGLLILLNEQVTTFASKGQALKSKEWWAFVDNVINAIRSLEEPNHPNLQLLLESLLIC